jgi:hypothetical protein
VLLPDAGLSGHVPALPAEEAPSCAQCNAADAADLKYRTTTSTDLGSIAPPAATALLMTPSRISDTTSSGSPCRPAEAFDDITGVTKPPRSPSVKPTSDADRSGSSSGSGSGNIGKVPPDRSCDSAGRVIPKPSASGDPTSVRDGPLPPRFPDSGSDSRSTLDSPRSTRSEESTLSFGNFGSEGTLSNSGVLPLSAEAASNSFDDASRKSPHSGGIMTRFHPSRPSGGGGGEGMQQSLQLVERSAPRTPRAANDDSDVGAEFVHASTASSLPSVPWAGSQESLPHTQEPEAADCDYSI